MQGITNQTEIIRCEQPLTFMYDLNKTRIETESFLSMNAVIQPHKKVAPKGKSMINSRVSGIAIVLLLTACGDHVPTLEATRKVEPPKGNVLRLHGEFTIIDHAVMTDKSPSGASADSDRELVIQGTFDQLVTVETLASDDSLIFRPVDNKPITVNATLKEHGQLHSSNPEAADIIKTESRSSYQGTIDDAPTLLVKRSPYGKGDEISLRMTATANGEGETIITRRKESAQRYNAGTNFGIFTVTLLESDPASPDAKRRKFKGNWLFLPTLAARPEGGFERQFYDVVAASPKMSHLGLTTSPNRDRWEYKGTKVLSDKATATGSQDWKETVEFVLRLEKP
jgi:hypothetical protein